jgi:hypothetical protein
VGVKVIDWKGAWWLDISHKGRRKRKRIGTGASAKKAADILTVRGRAAVSGAIAKVAQARSLPRA